MRRNKIYRLFLIGIALFVLGCSENNREGSKSLEEIQKEKGIPVVVQTIQPTHFEKSLKFFGTFRGQRETIVGAMIGGRVAKIFYKPGDKVAKDAVVIEFPEDSPAAQFRQAKSAYEYSKKNFERLKALYEKGEIAQAQYDGARTKFLVDKSNYETMKDLLKLKAPYAGTITDVMVHEGDNVKAKTPLFTIAKLNKMKLRIWLSEKERQQVKPGMVALATVAGQTFRGTVSDVSLGMNPVRQAFYADLIFDNAQGNILAGTTADVKVIIYENPQAIAIPRHLVQQKDGTFYVFLANKGKALQRPITIGQDNGLQYEIIDGLHAGDSLIVQGTAKLTNGIKINVVR